MDVSHELRLILDAQIAVLMRHRRGGHSLGKYGSWNRDTMQAGVDIGKDSLLECRIAT